MKKIFLTLCFSLLILQSLKADDKQTLRFVQDDAQDYMVSKIYTLKYAQSNDVAPFLTGIVKRYNMNSVVNMIEYGKDNQQILTVTCPVKFIPYVDDFIKKVDRNIKIDGKTPSYIVKGSGITRAIYQPKYRSGQILVDIIVNAFINAGPYGSVYGYDKNSNQIYWKDNTSNTEFMYTFLSWLDRPAPQINIVMKVYEVRESTLNDVGMDYLAWKNGPGLDLFQVGFQSFSLNSAGTAALQSASGPLGGFLFAPQFDMSFIRLLQQTGNAKVTSTANLTVANSDSQSYEIYFNPQLQNIIKEESDQSSVGLSSITTISDVNQLYMKITAPIVSIHSGKEIEFELKEYTPGMYAKHDGTLFFNYNIQSANVVDRSNLGAELIESSVMSGDVSVELNKEKVLASWDKSQEVEQVIGLPWLSSIPYIKYLFSTTTKSVETTKVYLTITAEIMNPQTQNEAAGVLKRLK